ncbi:hypothetical protein UPYG_G00234410 [Umbra pygmaea]|uniref:MULE transposase domain-containing protein n=1 Tax=Umbra pygmaea TaxID=75934 RepID=A0ABD0WEX1_UMBPY
MEGYINQVQEKEHYYFRPPVCPRQDYYYYGCDRGNHSAGKSNGEASKTRANSCKAYISFKVITDTGISGAIIQKMQHHTGHDENNSKEKNRIHPDLHSLVKIWLQLGWSTSEKLQLSNPSFYLRSVMMDRDLRVLNAMKSIFPNAKLLLCWFHVLQAVNRWLVKADGGHLTPEQRNVVIHAMASMKACLTEEEFLNVSAKKCSEIDTFLGAPHVTTYLKTNWFTYAEVWVNFGRTFYHCSSETNNKAESVLHTEHGLTIH